MIIIFTIIYGLFIFILTFYFNKTKTLPSYSGDRHQTYVNEKNVPLVGGIFLLPPLITLFLNYPTFLMFLTIIFFIGLMSDINFLTAPLKRILLQCFTIFIFIFFEELKIDSSRIYTFDLYLQNIYFSFLFVTFCILILINGSNFIDGLNGLLIGYVLIVVFILNHLGLLNGIDIYYENSVIFSFSVLILILVLNLNNKLMLGDAGAYCLGFTLAFIIIKLHNQNPNLSPYFFISLIWYPCFENLFSILRKFSLKISPTKPDNKHLHQLFFLILKKKLKFDNLICNNLSSLSLNTFNFIIIYCASINPSNTKFQIFIIFISIVSYLFIYTLLKKMINLDKHGTK